MCNPVDKVPLRVVDGLNASPTNPADWTTLAEAQAKIASDNSLILGFVLTEDDPYTVVDFDTYKIDPSPLTQEVKASIKANHANIFKAFDTYTELSPSGGGAHIWCKGWVPSRKFNEQFFEVYSSERFFTVTGNHIHGTEIAERQTLLDELIAYVDAATGQRRSNAPTVWTDQPEWFSDQQVIDKCKTDATGQRFTDLWEGRWRNYPEYQSQSEADLTLCNHIAVYTNNQEQAGRIYWSSPLFLNSPKRKRKARRDYLFNPRWGAVAKAFDQKLSTETYSDLVKYWESQKFEAVTVEDAKEVIASSVTWPTGLLGDVASYIYNQSIYRNPEVALVGAIALLSYLGGRAFNINGTGLNQYLVLLGETSVGKEDMSRGISALMKEIKKQLPSIVTYYISRGDVGSAQGLVKQLAMTPCMLVNKGEVGLWMQQMNAPSASGTYLGLLKACLMQLYHKSGKTDTLDGKNYSDKDVADVSSPCLTVVGDSTLDNFYRALDEDNIDEGLVARFTVVEVPKRKRIYNEDSLNYRTPLPQLVNGLVGFAKRCVELMMTQSVWDVKETPEAHSFQIDFVNKVNEVIDNDPSPFAKIKSRAHIQLLRLGALVAAGNNTDAPEVTLADYQWAQKLLDSGLALTQKRFEAGQVGDKSLYLEQHNHLKKILKNYSKAAWSDEMAKKYRVTFDMWKQRALPYATIQNNCAPYACFRKDKDTSRALYNVLREFESAGYIVKVDPATLLQWGKRGNVWSVTGELQ